MINMPINGEPTETYACWDDLDKVREEHDVWGNHCDNVGLWQHGPSTLTDFKSYVEARSSPRKPLQWSDVLALSASVYMNDLDGCSMYEEQIDEPPSLNWFIDNFATYRDHS